MADYSEQNRTKREKVEEGRRKKRSQYPGLIWSVWVLSPPKRSGEISRHTALIPPIIVARFVGMPPEFPPSKLARLVGIQPEFPPS